MSRIAASNVKKYDNLSRVVSVMSRDRVSRWRNPQVRLQSVRRTRGSLYASYRGTEMLARALGVSIFLV